MGNLLKRDIMKVFIITWSETSLGSETKSKQIFGIKTSDMPSLPAKENLSCSDLSWLNYPLNQNHPPVIVLSWRATLPKKVSLTRVCQK